jgi:hypothetical protein
MVHHVQNSVEDGCELLRNTPGIFERVRRVRSAARSMEAQGQHFEKFCNFSEQQANLKRWNQLFLNKHFPVDGLTL